MKYRDLLPLFTKSKMILLASIRNIMLLRFLITPKGFVAEVTSRTSACPSLTRTLNYCDFCRPWVMILGNVMLGTLAH